MNAPRAAAFLGRFALQLEHYMKSSLAVTRARDGSVSGRATGAAAQALVDSLIGNPKDSGAALAAASQAADSISLSDKKLAPDPAASIPLSPVTSSQIASAGHDSGTNTLVVCFKGRAKPAPHGGDLPPPQGPTYAYENVTAEQYAAMRAAESFNSYFTATIKKNTVDHPYRKIDA